MVANPPITRLREELDPESREAWLWLDESPEATQAWIEEYLTVANEHGQVVKFKCYPQQVLMLQDETGRDVTVKGRQTRASTLKLARRFRRFVSGQVWGANALIAAESDPTTALFRQKIVHWLQDLERHGYKIEKALDNEDELMFAGFENRIIWGSGEQKVLGRGFAIQEGHLSEFSHWKEAALEHVGAILPAVPGPPSGRVDIESTPKGEVGAFYKYATEARPANPYDIWTCHFYPWWLEPRYTVSADPADVGRVDIMLSAGQYQELRQDFEPTDYERKLMLVNELDISRILWRRIKKREQDKTPAPFLQEFPESLDTCFVGVQGKYFDTPDGTDHLEYYRERRKEPLKYLEALAYNGAQVSFFGANFGIWEFYRTGRQYLVWFDAAGGGQSDEDNFTVAYVLDIFADKIVARYRGKVSPRQLAPIIAAVGTEYGGAIIGGERSHQGATTLEELEALAYPNIYYHVDPLHPLKKGERAKAGVYPTSENRQRSLEEFKSIVTANAAEYYCKELVREQGVFTWQKVQNRLKPMAQNLAGQNDDCVMAAAGLYFVGSLLRKRLARQRVQEEQSVLTIGRFGQVIRRDPANSRRERLWLN